MNFLVALHINISPLERGLRGVFNKVSSKSKYLFHWKPLKLCTRADNPRLGLLPPF